MNPFAALLDDAALFPPGNAPMPVALRQHAAHRRAWYAELVGPFVCPLDRLPELDGAEIDVALTVPAGLAAIDGALRVRSAGHTVRVVATELPISADRLEAISALPGTRYGEVPTGAVTAALAASLQQAGIRLKLRTGGAFIPPSEQLGAAIVAAVEAGLPMKCTAGLHRLVRHPDPQTGQVQHGFGNVLLAVIAAQHDDDPVAELADEDPASVVSRLTALAVDDIISARTIFTSFGTCSIAEPLADLMQAGLVNAP